MIQNPHTVGPRHAVAVRSIFNKKLGIPVQGCIPNKLDPLLFNEESVIVGFGLYNPADLSSRIALYRVIDGNPSLSGVYRCQAGGNGIRPRTKDQQGPVNWLTGLLGEAATGGRQDGHYFLQARQAREANRKVQLPLDPKSCLDLCRGLAPARESTDFDIVVVDEIGAPGSLGEIPVKASKLRGIISNRFLSNLWAPNPTLVTMWRNAIDRGVELWEMHPEEIAAAAVEQIQGQVAEELTSHIQQNWVSGEDEKGNVLWHRPFFPGLVPKLHRIVDFYPALTQEPDGEFYPLQVCQKGQADHTPLFVGVQGSPVTVKSLEDVPARWEFPTTWEKSPFENLAA